MPNSSSAASRRSNQALVVLGLALGLAVGLAEGVVIGQASGLAIRFELDMLIVGGTGALTGLAFGIVFGSDRGVVAAIGPRKLIGRDLLYGLGYGVLIGLVAGFISAFAITIPYGIAVGMTLAVTCGLVVGPVAAVRYSIAVLVMAIRHRLPLRFAAFLDWAVAAGLLREVGVSYQFRHQELQQWLTSGATSTSSDSAAH